MATLTVRNLDDDLVRRLRIRAAEHGRSAEGEHREILRTTLLDGASVDEAERARRVAVAEQLAQFRQRVSGRGHSTAADLLEESRSARMGQLARGRTAISSKSGD